MEQFEFQIYKTIEHDSLLFLKEGVLKLISGRKKQNLNDIVVLSCVNIQIALELAIRAFLVRNNGINTIIDKTCLKKQNQQNTIEELYKRGNLKVNEFESIKKQLKRIKNIFLTKDDFMDIEKFQEYRNKIIHMCYPLDSDELEILRDNLMYYVVRIVIRLLYNNYDYQRPAEYFQELLGYDFYRILWDDDGYIKAIEGLAIERSKNVGLCPICDKNTYNIDDEFCFFCNEEPEPDSWGRTDCRFCGCKNAVIYDRLNVHNPGNKHCMPGLCQKCEEHTYIFECPMCGQTHWMYIDNFNHMCSDGHCAVLNEDYVSESVTEFMGNSCDQNGKNLL